jgi:hypothetical protein
MVIKRPALWLKLFRNGSLYRLACLTRPLLLCSTSINVMRTYAANTSFFPVQRIAAPIPTIRMSSSMERAGYEA